ncbi:hypothetical protein R3P38DRAFT_2873332 [Favolaschia claudopus]|uniref:DUF1214 domain-containing protein n=1 Tax=Favolaschia claudopus TaxID=2862362 RepID=A0AAW0D5M8_9AGAR
MGTTFVRSEPSPTVIAGKYLIKYRPSNAGCDLTPDESDQYAGTISLPTVYRRHPSSDVEHIVSSIQTASLSLPSHPLLRRPHPSHSPCSPTISILATARSTSFSFSHALLFTTQPKKPRMPHASQRPSKRRASPPALSLIHPTAQRQSRSRIHDRAHPRPAGLHEPRLPPPPRQRRRLGNHAPRPRRRLRTHYDVRAFIGLAGYPPPQLHTSHLPRVHPRPGFFRESDVFVEFFGRPDVMGFWSLTVYDGEGRSSLGDRANLTYPDGRLVYANGVSGDDTDAKSFYMLLQSTDVEVASEWESKCVCFFSLSSKFQR